MYQAQTQSSMQSKEKKECKLWKGKNRFFFIGLIIGILTAVIPLLVFILLLIKQPNSYSSSRTNVSSDIRWKSEGITVAGVTSSPGSATNQLNLPLDIKVDYLQSMYIVDRLNNRIQKYLKDSTTGSTVAGLLNCTATSSPYGFSNASHVLLDSNQNLYITDSGNFRVQFWPNGASFGKTVAGTGISGTGINQLRYSYGSTYDPVTNNLYVADYIGNRVMSYPSGATSDVLVAGGHGAGINNTQLNSPLGVYFDLLTNSLIIVNHAGHNVVRWKLGDDHWTLLAGDAQGTGGTSATSLSGPTFITLDPMGNLYVADRSNYRIQMFANGELTGKTVAGITRKSGSNSTLLHTPWSVALDNQLNLYVADAFNHRIQKFLRY